MATIQARAPRTRRMTKRRTIVRRKRDDFVEGAKDVEGALQKDPHVSAHHSVPKSSMQPSLVSVLPSLGRGYYTPSHRQRAYLERSLWLGMSRS